MIMVGKWASAERDDTLISITVSSTDRLYLTKDEMARLAEQVRQTLVCRTAAQVNDPVVVADVVLTPGEAWRLLEKLWNIGTDA